MTQPDDHPPEHVLAELTDPGVDDHVRRCESCQAVVRGLTEVTGLLKALPAQLPIPEQVSARIGTALAAEAARAAEPDELKTASATVTRLDDHPVAWFRRRVPQVLAAAAAVAVVGVAGYSLFTNGDTPVDVATAEDNGEQESTESDGMHMADSRESAPEGANAPAEDESGPGDPDVADDAGSGVEGQAQLSDELLTQTVTEVWEGRSEVEPRCGESLASEQEATLVGSANAGDEVLVVLTDSDQLTGWLLPGCAASSAAAEPAITVDVPAE